MKTTHSVGQHIETDQDKNAVLISVNMGYGHQRAAYNLTGLTNGKNPINANDYEGIPRADKKVWERSRALYEFMSNASRIPFVGGFIFSFLNYITQILNFYPKRNLSESNFGLRYLESLIRKGWGRHLIDSVRDSGVPFVTTFFASAHMADKFGYPGKIYCVVTDTDIARTWVSTDPHSSKIIYLAPTLEAQRRLLSYGVRESHVLLTGFPLPKENIGNEDFNIAKEDLKKRIINLDPHGTFRKQFAPLIKTYLGELPTHSGRPLTLMFSLGGAAAQRDLVITVAKSLESKIKNNEIRLVLAIGIKKDVQQMVRWQLGLSGLKHQIDKNIIILDALDIWQYFKVFNESLRHADILWTKPSELSFYAGLGIPVVIAPPIGSQEEFNKRWLMRSGAGIPQENPMYTDEWLMDLVDEGQLADAALHGFIELEKKGVFNIERIVEDR